MIYLCSEESSLLQLKENLSKLITAFTPSLPQDNSFLLNKRQDFEKLPKKQRKSRKLLHKKDSQEKGISLKIKEEPKCERPIPLDTNFQADVHIPDTVKPLLPNSPPPPSTYKADLLPTEEKTSTIMQPMSTIIVDESDPVPVVWVSIEPDELYKCSKKNILDPHGWLYGTEIHAGQALLHCQFPLVGGLQDPIFSGELVTPATTEFVQIVNSGAHWVCLSTIGCVLGEVKLFDSLYDRVNSIMRLHTCRMLIHTYHFKPEMPDPEQLE